MSAQKDKNYFGKNTCIGKYTWNSFKNLFFDLKHTWYSFRNLFLGVCIWKKWNTVAQYKYVWFHKITLKKMVPSY